MTNADTAKTAANERGRFGRFGGRYVPEALWEPLVRLSTTLDDAMAHADFLADYERWLDHRLGRPTPVSMLAHLSRQLGGASLWLKREDLCQGGSFCANLALFYGLLARHMGMDEVVGETATGDFGVALGMAAAAIGLQARVYMSREDMSHEPAALAFMERLGVEVVQVDVLTRGRTGPGGEALRYWMRRPHRSLYCSSSLAAPDPYPRIIADALAVIGAETRVQLARRGCDASYVIAPVGSGSFAAGLFSAFLDDESTRLIGVQAGGEPQAGRHASILLTGAPGVFSGTFSQLLQDAQGQILNPYSIAGGLCTSVVGPQHADWAERAAVLYASINDVEAARAQQTLYRAEGISLSLEACHALAYAIKLSTTLAPERHVVIGASGSGWRELARATPADR